LSKKKRRSAPPVRILVLDRSVDPLTPVMHDYHYQAMAQDLLTIKDNIYTYEITNVKGFTSEKSAKLGDGDELWEEFKYTHIQDAYSALQKKFQNFVK